MSKAHLATMLLRRQLTTFELDKALSDNVHTQRLYAGTFPVDLLPRFKPQPNSLIVVNKGTSHTSGTHWILVYVPFFTSGSKGSWYFFDSLGNGFEDDDYLWTYFKRSNAAKIKYNRVKLQHEDSKACGYFVLAIAWLIARGARPEKLTDYFSKRDLAFNDRLVGRIAKEQFMIT